MGLTVFNLHAIVKELAVSNFKRLMLINVQGLRVLKVKWFVLTKSSHHATDFPLSVYRFIFIELFGT